MTDFSHYSDARSTTRPDKEIRAGSLETHFPFGETREWSGQLQGSEGDAGGGSIADQSNKMANTIDRNKQLPKTCNPVNVASVRRFDDARVIGAKKLEQRAPESVMTPPLVTLLKLGTGAKPLK
jgi:hypothetical protein